MQGRVELATYVLGAKDGVGKGSFLRFQGRKLQTWHVVMVGASHTYQHTKICHLVPEKRDYP